MADRRFLELYDIPILNDEFYCLDNGPVDSLTYDYVKGQGLQRSEWEEYIKGRQDNVVRLAKPANRLSLDELSIAEEKVLRYITKKFKRLRSFELVDYVHQTCKEWKHPGGGSTCLTYDDVFKALGKDNIPRRVRHIQEMRNYAASKR